jgi:ribonuclease P protein component
MERLRQRADFLAAAAGARVGVPAFTVQARDRQDPGPVRIGFTVSRKVGTAVERNRVRRRLRDLVARTPFSRPHCDYVLVGRRAALGRGFDTMLDDLKSALKRLDAQLAKRAGTAG